MGSRGGAELVCFGAGSSGVKLWRDSEGLPGKMPSPDGLGTQDVSRARSVLTVLAGVARASGLESGPVFRS